MEQTKLQLQFRETRPCSGQPDTTGRFKHSLVEAFGPYAVLTIEDDSPRNWESSFSKVFSKTTLAVLGASAFGSLVFSIVNQGVRHG